jgi:hypothetical protein
MNGTTFAVAIASAVMQAISAGVHRQDRIGRQVLTQFIVAGVAGALPNLTGLNDMASRELMILILRIVGSLVTEERMVFAHAFDSVMNDTTAVLAYNSVAPVLGKNPTSLPPSAPAPTSVPETRGFTGSSGSAGNVGPPRPNDAPLGNSTTPASAVVTNNTSYYAPNPWGG